MFLPLVGVFLAHLGCVGRGGFFVMRGVCGALAIIIVGVNGII